MLADLLLPDRVAGGWKPLDRLYPIRYTYHMAPIERVARRIRRLRERRGWSQQGLAERAGLSRTYLARLETARQDPTLSTLAKLAKALKVPLAELVK
jgi:ribosome-binding protein aMBF1 (putative translation factor)